MTTGIQVVSPPHLLLIESFFEGETSGYVVFSHLYTFKAERYRYNTICEYKIN